MLFSPCVLFLCCLCQSASFFFGHLSPIFQWQKGENGDGEKHEHCNSWSKTPQSLAKNTEQNHLKCWHLKKEVSIPLNVFSSVLVPDTCVLFFAWNICLYILPGICQKLLAYNVGVQRAHLGYAAPDYVNTHRVP